jgi:hypothetical protein
MRLLRLQRARYRGHSRYSGSRYGYLLEIAQEERIAMEGFEVVTSDDCKFGRVVDVRENHLIVEHGTLRKSKFAVPETFAHTDDSEQTVRLSVSKAIIEASPKIDNGTIDSDAVAEHYGLAEATAAPETEGYGDLLPDDPGRSAAEEDVQAGRETPDQQRAAIREGGFRPEQEDLGSSPGLLGDRVQRR